jgi:threonine dehydratase
MIAPLKAPTLDDITAARLRIAGGVVRTPLVRLPVEDGPAELYLKLENLQPIGSFKLRGPLNAMRAAPRGSLRDGVYTASAGNHGQGVAWAARELGVPCTVIVPAHAPATKVEALGRLGARVITLPVDDWWRVIEQHQHPGTAGRFIHPAADPDVIAANATIGVELLADLPDVDAVLVPYGGGGLSCGIATALRALRSAATVTAVEVETSAPLTASLKAGAATRVERKPSFVDGIGGKSVLPEMFPLASSLLAGTIVVSLDQIVSAIRVLVERVHVVAEGAGAAAVAAGLSGKARGRKIVCVVSGGNLEPATLLTILGGQKP